MAEEYPRFDVRHTDNPELFTVVVSMKVAEWCDVAIPVSDVTTLATLQHVDKPRSERFADYVFRGYIDAPIGWLSMAFTKALTNEQRQTPYLTVYDNEPVSWPAVLRKLIPARDPNVSLQQRYNGNALETVQVPKWIMLEDFVPAWSGMCAIKIEKYLSDRPWTKEEIACDQPVPGSISWTLPDGSQGGFANCLHRREELPRWAQYYQVNDGSATANVAAPEALKARIFPETNFREWEDYTLRDGPNGAAMEGFYYPRTKVTVYAPDMPPSVKD